MKRPSILLNKFAGWRSALLDQVELVHDNAALRLKLLPGVARSVTSSDGTLGGFTNPVGLAVDRQGRIYVLDGADCVVKRFDPCLQSFQILPCIGGCGPLPRQFNAPRGLTISNENNLIVADSGNFRVAVYTIRALALRALIGPLVVDRVNDKIQIKYATISHSLAATSTNGSPASSVPAGTWTPRDVVVSAHGWLYVADYTNGLIHVFDEHLCWRKAFDGSSANSPALVKPIRVAVDLKRRIYVVQENSDHIVVLEKDGSFSANIFAPGDLEGRFCPTAIAVDGHGNLHVANKFSPGLMSYECVDENCSCCCAPAHSMAPGANSTDLVFDSSGNPIAINGKAVVQMSTDAIYESEGTFVTSSLDSRTYRCPWHRLTMQANIAPGTQISVETFTAEAVKPDAEVLGLPDSRWTPSAINATVGDCNWDCLVQSPPGRYLWLRLKFHSDGQESPCIDWLRVYYPRASSLQYLPECYSEDESSRLFLDQFLSIFDTLRDGIGDRIGKIASYFDPMATPAAQSTSGGTDFLSWLAGWVGLTLDRHWPEERRRKLLKNAWQLYKLRGTPEGLRLHLELYTGVEPQILEHFKLRRWMNTGSTTLGDNSALWGADIIDRLQLDAHAELGTVQLIDTGDPLTDPFSKEAHQFTVFVPQRGQVSTDPQADALQQITVQRIIDMSKPAHTVGYLQMIRPRFRIGIQAFIGKDTVVGSYPDQVVEGQSKLGYDSTLGPSPDEQGAPVMRIGKGTRIGATTLLN